MTIKMPIDAIHSDGDGRVIVRMDANGREDNFVNLTLRDALLFQKRLAQAISDEFGHFNAVAE